MSAGGSHSLLGCSTNGTVINAGDLTPTVMADSPGGLFKSGVSGWWVSFSVGCEY